jgi:hypothetical protein
MPKSGACSPGFAALFVPLPFQYILHPFQPFLRLLLPYLQVARRRSGPPVERGAWLLLSFDIDESSSEDGEEVSSDKHDNTAVEPTDELEEFDSLNDNPPLQLPTPEFTPVPEHTTPKPSREVFGDVGDPRNIISGPRRRQPSSRRHEAYITDLATPGDFPGFNTAFSAALLQPRKIPP